jgi:hypothetical protein
MDQPALFHERIEEALDEVIKTCGGRKKFASEMWPNKPHRDAHNLLDACLNPERREKFAPHDVLYVLKRGREADCHVAMEFLCGESGYTKPVPIDPESERAKRERELVETVKRAERLIDDIKRLTQPHLQTIAGGKG